MQPEVRSRPQMWKEVYQAAMEETDGARLPRLVDDAINVVLDRIEETCTQRELDDLNDALRRLRSRRQSIDRGKKGSRKGPGKSQAA